MGWSFYASDGTLLTQDSGGAPDGTDPGDILAWDGAAWDVLPVGADDEVLTADSGEALGLRWGAGGGVSVPTIIQFKQSTTAATSLVLDSTPVQGDALLLVSDATTGQISAVTQTNVTWTQLKTMTSGGGSYYALWVGIVGASASATITWTKPGSFSTVQVMEITDALTPTLGANTSGNCNTQLSISPTTGTLVVACGGTDNTTLSNTTRIATLVGLDTGSNFTSIAVAYATGGSAVASCVSNAGGWILAEVT